MSKEVWGEGGKPSTSVKVGFILADAYLECIGYFPNPSDMLGVDIDKSVSLSIYCLGE